MGEKAIKDEQIARFHLDIHDGQSGYIGMHRIAVRRLGLDPFLELFKQEWNTLESPDIPILLL